MASAKGRYSLLTSCDTETSVEVIGDSKERGIEAKRNPVGGDEANGGNDNDHDRVEPVHVLVEVAPRHGRVGDVDLCGIIVLFPQRLVFGRAIWKGRSLSSRGDRRRHLDGAVLSAASCCEVCC